MSRVAIYIPARQGFKLKAYRIVTTSYLPTGRQALRLNLRQIIGKRLDLLFLQCLFRNNRVESEILQSPLELQLN